MYKSTESFIEWQKENKSFNLEQLASSMIKYSLLREELIRGVDQKYMQMLEMDEESDCDELSADLSFGSSRNYEDEAEHSIGSYGQLEMDGLQEADVEGLSDD